MCLGLCTRTRTRRGGPCTSTSTRTGRASPSGSTSTTRDSSTTASTSSTLPRCGAKGWIQRLNIFSYTKYFSQSGYEEVDGSVFIYNSDSDDCPDDTGHNWYYWQTNRWIYDESIYLVQC